MEQEYAFLNLINYAYFTLNRIQNRDEDVFQKSQSQYRFHFHKFTIATFTHATIKKQTLKIKIINFQIYFHQSAIGDCKFIPDTFQSEAE